MNAFADDAYKETSADKTQQPSHGQPQLDDQTSSSPPANLKLSEVKIDAAADSKKSPLSKTSSESNIELEKIEVKAKRRVITPMPGLAVDRGQATTNIQSASGKELSESKALNVAEFMNAGLQSVTVNDYNGNPFQQDLNFRGFTASPSIGTPQGVSVYLDGVRINEAFGEVVNWDLIPMNALSSLDLIPGSNPLFGLNTLGGALALRTKNGFTDTHLRAQLLGGAWGRQQMQFSNGFNVKGFGFFTAYNHFQEDGWRDNSPTNLRQLYNAVTVRLPAGEVNFTALNVNSDLTGNGMLPYDTAAIDRTAVFTAPDGAKNKLGHYNLNGSWDISDNISVSGLAYRRNLDQSVLGGEINERYVRTIATLNGGDIDGDGTLDSAALNGILNKSGSKQKTNGAALQVSWDKGNHQMVAGVTRDANDIQFSQSQILAPIDAKHNISASNDPVFAAEGYENLVSFPGIIRNQLTGNSKTRSVFFSDTWSPNESLHLTYGARANWTNVQNVLKSDKGKDIANFNPRDFIPARQRCTSRIGTTNPYDTSKRLNLIGDSFARFICSAEEFDYRSLNPSFGVAWEPKQDLTVYGNLSRGARTPSVIELGCARDRQAEARDGSTNFQFGCTIPTSLTSDPYLKQVRSTALEAGFRGSNNGFDWNLGVFQTKLKDDILFVPLGSRNRGVFDNFGKTQRQGIEMGLKGNVGKSSFGINYTLMQATFESSAQIINPANSSNTATTTVQSYINIKPGDQLPGMPNHVVQANWNHQFNNQFDTTLSMVMHSFSYVRGNENNKHAPRVATNFDLNGDGNPDRDFYDYIGKGKISGYAVFNLKANYKLDHGITLFAKVDNLFDKKYANGGGLGLNPFTADGTFAYGGATPRDDSNWNNTTFIAPGAPRAAWFGLSFDLDWKNALKAKQ